MALKLDEVDRGVCLAAAAAALRQSAGTPISPRDRSWVDKVLTTARATLGAAGVERALVEGTSLSQDEAISYALELLDRNTTQQRRDARIVLSAREREVAELVARGLSNPRIAGVLIIGERTVQTHVSHILGKLGLSSRAQIAAWVTEQHAAARPMHDQ